MKTDINNSNLINRLFKYKSTLHELDNLGLVRVFSDNLGDAAGVKASQVRKDFSALKIKGNKKSGYSIEYLLKKLISILGETKEHNIIVIGCGNIGKALINHYGNRGTDYGVIAGFDTDPEKINPGSEIPILPMEKLGEVVKKNKVHVAIIAVPQSKASDVFNRTVKAGITGVLNFTKVHLRSNKKIVVNNIDIELHLENLLYFVKTSAGTL